MECRKHNHQSNKGVCPSCLRDKLSQLPNTPSYYVIHRSDDSLSLNTTVDSSSPASPPVKDHHRRAGSMSMSFAVREALSGNLIEGLKKSRSVAHRLLHLKGKGGGGASDVGGFVTSRQRVY
ncbi:unnamed protein product [Arabis nemorensis]|uniref:Uncharacterized protein n=1 Tax=Arabis nemorensis TaxID=586526 RepID=A0A565CWJ3_9BRAS|nr:unnamed protein product [Arabis nemorensis]